MGEKKKGTTKVNVLESSYSYITGVNQPTA
jgi:hypothetical protein